MTVSIDDDDRPRIANDRGAIDLDFAQPDDDDGSVFRESLASLRRRWRGLAIWLAICMAVASSYVFTATPRFVATAQVVLQPRQQVAPVDPATVATAPTLDSAQADSQTLVLQSERNLRFVFNTLDLANDPEFAPAKPGVIGWLISLVPLPFASSSLTPEETLHQSRELAYKTFAECVSVRRIAQSYAFEISFASASPAKAARLANSITAAYILDQVTYNVAAAAAQRGGDFLQNRVIDSKTEQDVATNAVKTGVIPDYTFGHADARIVSAALEPVNKTYPATTLILALAAFFGLVSGAGAVFVRDGLDRTIRSPEQVSRLAGISCLGALPRQQGRHSRSTGLLMLAAVDAPYSEFARTLRALRTTVLMAATGARHVSVGIVSFRGGEGRSCIAVNLACLLANSGVPVTLLDADIRNPMLTRTLAPNAQAGFNDLVVNRDVDATELRLPISQTLSFIPAIPLDAAYDPNLFVGSGETQQALLGLTDESAVVVDLPPLSLALPADPVSLGRAMAGVVIVAAINRTTLDELTQMVKTLRSGGVRILGVVLNDPVWK
ncbi:MAG: P-loop NTPase [Ancalomicrobiaceae bacterium]|nr:P-loop NTPase [Ancalomicrobiaceae bacterium]